MKLILAQINPLVGDIEGNTKKIIRLIHQARKKQGDLVIFPEMAVLGYPPRDLLELPLILEKSQKAIEQIAKESTDLAVLVGCIAPNPDRVGKTLYNAAYWLEEGKIRQILHKSLLPFYDVFDETRYFESGTRWETVDFGGMTIGVSVCEDIWTDPSLWKRPFYQVDPVAQLVGLGSKVLINISASPYCMGKYQQRRQMLEKLARQNQVAVVYVNQVGGNDELIFDGGSMVVDSQGDLVARAPFFKEGLTVVDLQNKPLQNYKEPDELDLLAQALICGLKDYVRKCGFKKAALGLSGGIDSALVAALAVKALGSQNVLGLLLPSRYTSRESIRDALALAKNLKIKTKIIPIHDIHLAYEKKIRKIFGNKKQDATEENIQARIRGNLLMALSNKEGYLVLSTGNKSELAVGYCTLYGDMSGGLSVIADVPKTDVYELSRRFKSIPSTILTKAPTAELKLNQKDQDILPPYEVLDGIIKAYVEELKSPEEIVSAGFDKKTVAQVLAMIHRNEYKRRQAAPGLKVTSKAFGMGRRFPIACRL